VLDILATYLFNNKQVSIPHVGTFEVQYRPAVLQFAEREIHAPAYDVIYSSDVNVKEEQMRFLSQMTNMDLEAIHEQLLQLGNVLKTRLAKHSFEWKGVGLLNASDNGIHFESQVNNPLKPVAAHKVIHENAQHNVRVGEQHLQSGEATERLHTPDTIKKSPLMLIVWLLIILAILFIGYHLYLNGFRISSSGSQQKLTGWLNDVELP
jgi:hypothetical protein